MKTTTHRFLLALLWTWFELLHASITYGVYRICGVSPSNSLFFSVNHDKALVMLKTRTTTTTHLHYFLPLLAVSHFSSLNLYKSLAFQFYLLLRFSICQSYKKKNGQGKTMEFKIHFRLINHVMSMVLELCWNLVVSSD